MRLILAVVFVLATVALILISTQDDVAMKQCELTYSHDVCFQLLNR